MYFTVVGKVIKSKEDKAYVRACESEKGSFITFNFMAKANGNLVFLQSQYWDSKTYKKDKLYLIDKQGNTFDIPISQKDDPEILAKVPEFKKYVIDRYPSGYVYGLEKLVKGFDEASDEDKAKFKVTTLEEAKAKYEKVKKGRYEFLDNVDFTEALHNLFEKDSHIEEGKWVITGERVAFFNEKKNEWNTKYEVKKIQKAYDDAEETATVSEKFLFLNDAVKETKDGLSITGYSVVYTGKDKTTGEKLPNKYCPVQFEVPKKSDAFIGGMKKRFDVDPDEENPNAVKEMGVVLNILNGAEKIEFTEDMLTDADKENIDWGLTTFEDIKKERTAYGESKQGFSFAKLGKGYSVLVDTAYTKGAILGKKATEDSDELGDELDSLDLDSFEDLDL